MMLLSLIDTNFVIVFLKKDPAATRLWFRLNNMAVPSIVVGELLFGAYYSARVEHNLNQIYGLELTAKVLQVDAETAEYFGQIKARLTKTGRLIPENDIWIAALALQHSALLVTHDRHFAHVEGLEVQSW